MSTFVGSLPLETISRFDKKINKKTDVPYHVVVKQYNKHMGGVDLLDSHLGRYRNKMRSKKYYFRVFYHLLDVVMINSWILYKKVKADDPLSKINLAKFREEVAICLCKIGSKKPYSKRGRPSMLEVENGIEAKKHKGPATTMPVKNVRLDEVGHWPEYMDSRQRCKLPN